MKKLVAAIFLALIIVFGLASCTKSEPSDNSNIGSETSGIFNAEEYVEESKLIYTETEYVNDTKITREYRNGKQDFTVTEEMLNDDGKCYEKCIRIYTNGVEIFCERVLFSQDDWTVESENKIYYDDNHIAMKCETYFKGNDYIKESSVNFDADGKIKDGIEAKLLPNREKISDGIITRETIKGYDCLVTKETVYKNGEISKYKTSIYSNDNMEYVYYEVTDTNRNVLYTREYIVDYETTFVSGENGAMITVLDQVTVYTAHDGTLIAEVTKNANGTTVTKIGSEYTAYNIIERINKVEELIDEYINIMP